MKLTRNITRKQYMTAGIAVAILLLSCGIFFAARAGWLPGVGGERELTEEELAAKEMERIERLETLVEKYDYFQHSFDAEKHTRETPFEVAFTQDICAVVRVKEVFNSTERDLYWAKFYNDQYGTDYADVTREQIWKMIEETPALAYGVSPKTVQVEVLEYLYDNTELYLPELTLSALHTEPGDCGVGWHPSYWNVAPGTELVLFCTAPESASQGYGGGNRWGYFITEDEYLVPMNTSYGDASVVAHGGLQLEEYKEIVLEIHDEYEKRRAIVHYLTREVAQLEHEDKALANYIMLQEKQRRNGLEVYLLGNVAEKDNNGLRNKKQESGLLWLRLEKIGESYEVVDGRWNWNGNNKEKFPKKILRLAEEYGYPDANYQETLVEAGDVSWSYFLWDNFTDMKEKKAQWGEYWSYQEPKLERKELPIGDENRLERLEQLLPDYFKNYGDATKPITYVAEDLVYESSLEHLLTNLDHDICAVVEVAHGLENTIDELFYRSDYNEYFGTTFKSLTGEQVRELAVAQPRTMELIQRGEMTVQVQEYLFDKTGLEVKTLTIDAPVDRERKIGRWKVAAGMKLILFLDAPNDASMLYDSSVAWAYYITEEGYLVPLTLSYHEDMLDYGGMELDQYKELILEGYSAYEEPANVTAERQSRMEQWGSYYYNK